VIRRLVAWAAHRRDAMVTAALDEPEDLRPWDHDLGQLLRESTD
jgi:hypothetical protein